MPKRSWITEVILDIAQDYRSSLKEEAKAPQETPFMEERLSGRVSRRRLEAMSEAEVKAFREKVGVPEVLSILRREERPSRFRKEE